MSVKFIIDKSKSILKKNTLGYLAFASSIIMLFTKLSGIFKLQILTSIYGIKSIELSLFHGANTIPEFLFLIIAIGSFNAAIIPVLTEIKYKKNMDEFNKILSSLLNLFLIIMIVLCILIFFLAYPIATVIVKSQIAQIPSTLGQEELEKFAVLLRILMLSPIILAFSSVLSCSLQIKKRFLITQLSPLFYNLGIILTAIFILPMFDNNIYILSVGVIIGSILHLAIQIPFLKGVGIRYNLFSFDFSNYYVRKSVQLTIPRTIGLSVDYIGNIFQMFIGLRILGDSFNAFKIANSLREMPNSIFGSAISQAYFPKMNAMAKKQEMLKLQKLFSSAIRTILFWTVPITAILIVLRTPIVRLSFGIFDSDATFTDISLISYSLLFLSFGIISYSLLNIVNRMFFVLDDTKTTTFVSIFVIILEVTLMIGLANVFSYFNNFSINPILFINDINNYFTSGNSINAIGGIALASSIAALANLLLLIFFLKKKKVQFLYDKKLVFVKFISGGVMLIVGFTSFKFLENYFDEESLVALLILTVNVLIIMLATYIGMEKLQNDKDLDILMKPARKIKNNIGKVNNIFSRGQITVTPEP